MFDLVADVERYGEFVPACSHVAVSSRSRHHDVETVQASMYIGYKAISECVNCHIQIDHAALTIDVESTGGPMRYLVNNWAFRDVRGAGCCVDFKIDFALKSRTLSLFVGGLFDKVLLRLIDAFENRAAQFYDDRA